MQTCLCVEKKVTNGVKSSLRDVVEDGGENAQSRISAARSILEYSLKLTEQNDIVSKLQELEAAVRDQQDGR